MSRPIVVTLCMLLSSESWSPQRRPLNGTYVPVEEPSTASIGDMLSISGRLGGGSLGGTYVPVEEPSTASGADLARLIATQLRGFPDIRSG